MPSVYVKSPFAFDFRDEPAAAPAAGQVLVRVAYCGICGSDMHLARAAATDWTPIGHEVSGIVAAVGEGVHHVGPGDRVGLDCGNNCGVCPDCRAGRLRRCTGLRGFYGSQSGFADRVLVWAQNVHPVGEMDLKTACLLEPFGVAMNLFASCEIDFLDDVLLLGPGPIGLLALAACKARGARSLTALGRAAGARLNVAQQLGAAAEVISGDPAALLTRRFPDGFDKVIVTAPPELLPAAVAACRTGGVIAYCGLAAPGRAAVAIDWDLVHERNVQIRPMGEVPCRLPQAIELLRRGAIDTDAFITQTFRRDRIAEAFGRIERAREEVVKAVVEVAGEQAAE